MTRKGFFARPAALALSLAAALSAPCAAGAGPGLAYNPAARIDSRTIASAPSSRPGDWLTYGGGYSSQRFSALEQINAANVSRLAPVWLKQFGIQEGFEATPLVVNGVMYVTTGGPTALWALDAVTGRERWHYQSAISDDVPACCGWVNRGAAVADGKVFFETLGAELVALDAQSGDVVWKQRIADPRDGYTATVAPLVVKDKVIAGISGGENGVRGFLDAYDLRTGKRAWRFWTVPGPGVPGHETWSGTAWITGGGTTWTTGSYDPELNTLYWTTGNPSPDFNGDVRPGDNLYTASVVALDPDTGALRWHFQMSPHDVWDYDANSEVVLASLTIGGRRVEALIHADKNGYFYALDRTNGRFLYAKPYARVTWAKGIDPRSGRPTVNPDALPGPSMVTVCPGPAGGKEWVPMAFSPRTNLAYVPVIENCAGFRVGQAFYQRGLPFWGSVALANVMGPVESYGMLEAIDASTGEAVWSVPSKHPVVSGVLATASDLVFWGEADGLFHATHARTGKDLWRYNVGSGIHAGPMTFAVNGKQYVAIAAGWGGWVKAFAPELMDQPRAHTLVVFALPNGGGRR